MRPTVLDEIIAQKSVRVEEAKRSVGVDSLIEQARERKGSRRFADKVSTPERINVIAEFKRASPSKGVINNSLDPASVARIYKNGGACAISVLTEEDFFHGSLDDLRAIRAAVDLPILRKDFIIDEYQIYESAAAGADAVLLIVSASTSENLRRFHMLADDVGLDAVLEVHDREELEIAKSIGAKIMGVNNRDLKTFELSLDVSRELIKHAPSKTILISESGLKTREDVIELRNLGYSAFLIGETLMRSSDPKSELQKLTNDQS